MEDTSHPIPTPRMAKTKQGEQHVSIVQRTEQDEQIQDEKQQ
jgi:hypothetical protein